MGRVSGGLKLGPMRLQFVYPCKDGHVSITFLFGSAIGPFTRRFMEWMHEEGRCDEATRDKDWLDYANQLYDGREPVEEYERLKRLVGDFCMSKTKAELLETVWGFRSQRRTHTLDSHASRLRQKLRVHSASGWLANEWGVGYRLCRPE